VIRQDGSSSHGKPGTLHKLDADALRAQGITVRDDNIVEWFEIERGDGLEMLLEALGQLYDVAQLLREHGHLADRSVV